MLAAWFGLTATCVRSSICAETSAAHATTAKPNIAANDYFDGSFGPDSAVDRHVHRRAVAEQQRRTDRVPTTWIRRARHGGHRVPSGVEARNGPIVAVEDTRIRIGT